MVKTVEGGFNGAGKRFAVVSARFNAFLAESLLAAAVDTLRRHGVADDDITVVRCPGSFEVPPTTRQLAQSGGFDAIVCLGVLIRGATPHFDYISSEATKGIALVGMETGIPVTYGVLTCDTLEQAIERAGTKAGNKGADAAMAALEMANLYEQLGHR